MRLVPFRGKSPAPRRAFWNDLTGAINSLQKIAGRNVSVSEHIGKGTVINARRDRATTPACASCALPSGDCPHAFCLEFMLDDDDTSNRDLIEINGSSGNQIGFYYDQAGNWQLYAAGTGPQIVIPTANPTGVWHSAMIQITRVDADNVNIVLTVDGNSDNGDFAWSSADAATANIRVGALQGDSNPVHRTFRCVAALGNPDNSETDFFFPASSFDSLTAGASIDGSGFLRIDHGAVAVDDYAEKNISDDLVCELGACCASDGTCTIQNESDCTDSGGDFQGAGTTCDDVLCCVSSMTAQLSGLTFCTNCIYLSSTCGLKVIDLSSGSSTSVTGGRWPSVECMACEWDNLTQSTKPQVTLNQYHSVVFDLSGNAICCPDDDPGSCDPETPPLTSIDCDIIIVAGKMGATYYGLAYALVTLSGFCGGGGVNLLLFYGSSSTPIISNSLTCDTNFNATSISNDDFLNCIGIDLTGTVFAYGGSMTLS